VKLRELKIDFGVVARVVQSAVIRVSGGLDKYQL
jgi:hypothetical protein